jgi:ABC-2 type transport system permease protein
MNYNLIQKLVLKDWYFQRFTILGFLMAGLVSLVILSLPGTAFFMAGSILLITVLFTFGPMLVIALTVTERTAQTLPFLFSLPISMKEYTTAKMVSNFFIFLVPWLILLIACFIAITTQQSLPDGMFPFALVVLTEILVSYSLLLSISLITESQGWNTVGILAGNLLFQAFLYPVANLEAVKSVMYGSSIVWNSTFTIILLLEFLVIAALLGITFLVQFRKTEFV